MVLVLGTENVPIFGTFFFGNMTFETHPKAYANTFLHPIAPPLTISLNA